MEAKLIVLEGKHRDREIPLPETIFLVGRDRQCHLRPHCELVSKLHCAIAAWAGKVRVRDLKSRNGTYLNGKLIDGEVVVNDGDRLQVGALVFAFWIKSEGVPIVPPLQEGDVAWLLASPDDSDVLLPASGTKVLPPLSELEKGSEASPNGTEEASPDPSGSAGSKSGSKAVSAGKNLHDYFKQRKRRPGPAAGKNPPPQ